MHTSPFDSSTLTPYNNPFYSPYRGHIEEVSYYKINILGRCHNVQICSHSTIYPLKNTSQPYSMKTLAIFAKKTKAPLKKYKNIKTNMLYRYKYEYKYEYNIHG